MNIPERKGSKEARNEKEDMETQNVGHPMPTQSECKGEIDYFAPSEL